MSLIGSLLGLVLIPLKARSPAPPKEIDNLAVMALAEEVKLLQLALDHWRTAGTTLMAENEGLRRELRGARDERDLARAELRELMVQKDPTSPYYRRGGFAQAQQAYNQGFDPQNAYAHYTCVPARSKAFGDIR